MRRYRKHVLIQRKEILKRFYGFSQGHAVYAIVHRNLNGKTPIYVGESRNPDKRFRQHLAVMFGGRKGEGALAQKLKKIKHKSEIIEFHHLENVENIGHALAREASWAQALKSSGFELANTWAEHHSNAKCISKKRLMSRMRVSELDKLGVNLVLDCPNCSSCITIAKSALETLSIYDVVILSLDETISCNKCQCRMRVNLSNPSKLDHLLSINPNTCDVESFKLSLGII